MTKNLLFALLTISSAASAASVITARLDDPKAVYLAAPEFSVHGDGETDDSLAIQAAIDKAENHAQKESSS